MIAMLTAAVVLLSQDCAMAVPITHEVITQV
jgi:hypothetical protein